MPVYAYMSMASRITMGVHTLVCQSNFSNSYLATTPPPFSSAIQTKKNFENYGRPLISFKLSESFKPVAQGVPEIFHEINVPGRGHNLPPPWVGLTLNFFQKGAVYGKCTAVHAFTSGSCLCFSFQVCVDEFRITFNQPLRFLISEPTDPPTTPTPSTFEMNFFWFLRSLVCLIYYYYYYGYE